MEPRKRLYETTFIVNASLEDSQIEGAIGHIQEIITRNGGEITAVNKWGRKRLAYTIQKKNNGYYANVEFVGTEPVIAQLQRTYHLDQNFLRYLTLLIDPRQIKARLLAPPVPVAIPLPLAAAPLPPAAAAPLPPAAAAPLPPASAALPLPAQAAPTVPQVPGAEAVPPTPGAEMEKKPLFEDEPGESGSPKAA